LINQNCTLDGLGSLNPTANGPAVNALRNVTLKHVQQKWELVLRKGHAQTR
jgi:hypothetical protein